MKWTEVTEKFNRRRLSRDRLCRQRIVQIHDQALQKLRNALMNDPLVRDWAIDMGVDTDESSRAS